MTKYPGIKTKILKDGSKNIMVRFKYNSKIYPIKNFTKLYGCKSEKQAFEKLQEVKVDISRGVDPFETRGMTLNDIFYDRLNKFKESGEWRKISCENYTYFYNKHIKNKIGSKKIEKITYDNVNDIIYSFNVNQKSSRNLVIALLKPIFNEEMEKGNINKNILSNMKTFSIPIRENISDRVENECKIEIIRELYTNIENYELKKKKERLSQVKAFLYLVIMTSKRHGEILQLKKENCDLKNMKITSPKENTKNKSTSQFPIPEECLDYIKNCESGILFNDIKRGSIADLFQNLIRLTKIEVKENKRISLHDMRRLMLTIMIKDLKIDSLIADFCLDHKPKGVIKHYLEFNYDDKKNAYNKYWELIRK